VQGPKDNDKQDILIDSYLGHLPRASFSYNSISRLHTHFLTGPTSLPVINGCPDRCRSTNQEQLLKILNC
jgi:hypothetical protein